MAGKSFVKYILIIFILLTTGCSGLRFSQSAPEVKDFHPKIVAVFPVEVWNHKDETDSREAVEQIVAGSLVEKKWFAGVVYADDLKKQIQTNDELKKVMTDYLSKLRMLDYSDPDLSKKIGELAKTDAFLMISVDDWEYYVEREKKMAKVGLTMELYDTSTGKLMWKAGYAIAEDYVIMKPDLPKIAQNVARKMISYMPH
jgi:PBP1b-binding outer membrane lipoprotein LpoB